MVQVDLKMYFGLLAIKSYRLK